MEQFLTGLGLSGSAGLNAYLPLMIIGVTHRLGWVEVASPYDNLSSTPALIIVFILLLVEMTADKIPAIDHTNDLINTVIRPAAGALLMLASTSGTDDNLNPALMLTISILAGSISAGSVHGIKASARPAVTLTTFGFGNIVVSLIEDVIAVVVSLFAILIPFVVIFFAMSVVSLTGWIVWDLRRTRQIFRSMQYDTLDTAVP